MKLSETTIEAIRTAAAGKGCRLLEVESAGAGRYSVLRIVLERQDGGSVTLEDCEAVSRDVSPVLDGADEIRHRYALEVSSAGLERKLYSLEDAERFVGRRVRVKTQHPVQSEPLETGQAARGAALPARNFAGTLRGLQGDVLTVVDEENRKIYNVRFGDIAVARLDFLWPDKVN